MTTRPSKLFIGIGHVLKRDDGVGVRAAEIMALCTLPPDVEVFDAGLVGWGLADILEDRDLVVVVDAIDAGTEPGSVFRLSDEDLRPVAGNRLSLHDLHLLDALAETRMLGRAPRRVVFFGIQPADVSTGIGLSPEVEAALDRTITLAARELGLCDPASRPVVETSWSS